MGFLASIFGGGGAGFQAQGTNIASPTTTGQANTAYGQTQSGISQQQSFLNALANQGGIGNQSSVFSQQQALANQLGQQAQGQGPNPALDQLAQTTGQNVAQQGSLMAGQRGSSANAGLIARQAAEQGAGIQQGAVGQAATLRAQQQLAAQQQLQQQQANMAGLAGTQVGQQAGALGGYNQAVQGQQQNLLNSVAQQNNANVQMQGNINSANAGVQAQNASTQGGILGKVAGGIGSALLLSGGGVVPPSLNGPQSSVGKMLSGGTDAFSKGFDSMFNPQAIAQPQPEPASTIPSSAAWASAMGAPGTMNPLGQPTSLATYNMYQALPDAMASGGNVGNKLRQGGKVPGKAKVQGDSLKNDTVNAKLSPDEIVLPRSITTAPDADKKAAAFVRAILSRQGR